DVHSIYFEMLGEHGYVGLVLFITLLGTAFLTASKTIFTARRHPELRWAADLARMFQVALIGYATAGAFLTLATSHEYWQIVALTGAREAYGRRGVRARRAGQPIEPETQGRGDWLRPPPATKGRWRRPAPAGARPMPAPAGARPMPAPAGARPMPA